jgi:quercetin dioxygenase-like cupin family protein
MNYVKLKNRKVLFILLLSFLTVMFFNPTEMVAQTNGAYTEIKIQDKIGDGKEKEVNMLFEGEKRIIAQLILRDGTNLRWHSVAEPITIQCIAGEGELQIKNEEKTDTLKLIPGTLVTLESLVDHDIVGKPSVSIVLVRFLNGSENNK